MFVYVRNDKQEERDSRLEIELDRHCVPCNKVFAATVVGLGKGRAATGADAAFDAEDAAQRDAAFLVRFAPCPRCQQREGAAVRSFWLALLGGVIAATALVVGALVMFDIGALEDGGRDGFYLVAAFSVGGVGLAGLSVKKAFTRWNGSRDRVRFLSPSSASKGAS